MGLKWLTMRLTNNSHVLAIVTTQVFDKLLSWRTTGSRTNCKEVRITEQRLRRNVQRNGHANRGGIGGGVRP